LSAVLPEELLSALEGIKGFDKESFVKTHLSGEQVVSVRINPQKLSSENHQILWDEFSPIMSAKIPWNSNGYYLSSRPVFTFDPFFHGGLYYVQEASSMFLEEALKQSVDISKPLRILDLCAAPGGKSTLLQSLISDESLLVSNELIKSRVNILQENIIKWGASNIIVTNNDPADFSRLENYFDVILVDAPCSGSGLFRRDPEAIGEWSRENVKLCSYRQQRILTDVWPGLKKNGLLIYSTCSYSKQENEDIMDWAVEKFAADSLSISIKPEWNIVESRSDMHKGHGYRFYPDKIKGEGFFMGCLQKKEGSNFGYPRSKRQSLDKPGKNEEAILRRYIKSAEDNTPVGFFKHNDMLYALPENLENDVIFLRNRLYLRKGGVLMGKLNSEILIPEHELAMSTIISTKIPSIEVDKENAIQYLRKEELKTSVSGKGWALIRYKQHNLGWVKLLQNRFNNYYPADWRIVMKKVRSEK
jgi:16S rRNA C967 or C1407 C5-methylase (RsmB/RsmF family)/NOL1/NOP2/fmu family ribosome biogenesis protein